MRGIYISPGFGLAGAILGAAIVLAPVVVPWPIYGGFEELELILLVPTRWAVALGSSGAVVGGVVGALAGRSIVEVSLDLLRRIASWIPWW